MHRKKILAVAVAGALSMGSAGVALAAGGAGESNYVIYGKLYPQVSSYDYDGATLSGTTGGSSLVAAPSATANHSQRSTVDVSNSRIGFRGSEDLGGGLRAIFQIEQRVRFDNGTGTWAGNRDSFVGLAGGLGAFKVGNMDTAYKQVGDKLSFLGISSGNFVANSNLLARGPTDAIDFHLRQANVMNYESPKFFGLQFLGSWGKDENKGNPGTSTNVLLLSYGLTYEMGPLYLALGYEIHKDFFAGSVGFTAVSSPAAARGPDVRSSDTAARVTAMYKIGETTLSLDVSEIELNESGLILAGDFKSYKNQRIAAGVEQKFGNITGAVSVVTSDKGTCTLEGAATCDTAGLDGRIINVGGSYEFSRRTSAFVIFSQMKNGQSAAYNSVAINPSGGTAPQQGEDVTAIGVGVSHSF